MSLHAIMPEDREKLDEIRHSKTTSGDQSVLYVVFLTGIGMSSKVLDVHSASHYQVMASFGHLDILHM